MLKVISHLLCTALEDSGSHSVVLCLTCLLCTRYGSARVMGLANVPSSQELSLLADDCAFLSRPRVG